MQDKSKNRIERSSPRLINFIKWYYYRSRVDYSHPLAGVAAMYHQAANVRENTKQFFGKIYSLLYCYSTFSFSFWSALSKEATENAIESTTS